MTTHAVRVSKIFRGTPRVKKQEEHHLSLLTFDKFEGDIFSHIGWLQTLFKLMDCFTILTSLLLPGYFVSLPGLIAFTAVIFFHTIQFQASVGKHYR